MHELPLINVIQQNDFFLKKEITGTEIYIYLSKYIYIYYSGGMV